MNAPGSSHHVLPQVARRDVSPEALQALQARFGEQCSLAQAVREQHGRDESAFTTVPPPDAVIFAQSTQDVADAVALCAQHLVPIIPFGVGSSLEGHLLAVQGGVSIDLGRMNKVLRVNPEDLTVTVQPGVTRKQLNEDIKSTGLFFPIDPGADASIGGMAATRASGTNAVRYGTMRDNVLALEVVTASGKVYPEIEVKISPDVSGEIVELAVKEGDSVQKGQTLARIYADIYATQRDQASAVVNLRPGCSRAIATTAH